MSAERAEGISPGSTATSCTASSLDGEVSGEGHAVPVRTGP